MCVRYVAYRIIAHTTVGANLPGILVQNYVQLKCLIRVSSILMNMLIRM
jgi:hypothetical protein